MVDIRPRNAVLAHLSPASWALIAPELRLVELPMTQRIYEPGEPIDTVYFPLNCLLSQVNRSAGGDGVETAMAGCDGASGVIETMGSGRSVWESMVQVDGQALAIPAKTVRRLIASDSGFASACWGLAEQQIMESQQSVACQAHHPGEQRLARWILEAHDRSDGRNPLPLTQEVLAIMLGVQRTTVNAFLSRLQQRGMIASRRGKVGIVDYAALDAGACECRGIMRLRRQLLGLGPPARNVA